MRCHSSPATSMSTSPSLRPSSHLATEEWYVGCVAVFYSKACNSMRPRSSAEYATTISKFNNIQSNTRQRCQLRLAMPWLSWRIDGIRLMIWSRQIRNVWQQEQTEINKAWCRNLPVLSVNRHNYMNFHFANFESSAFGGWTGRCRSIFVARSQKSLSFSTCT